LFTNQVKGAKRKAAEEGRPVSDLIQDALEQYLKKGATTPKERQISRTIFSWISIPIFCFISLLRSTETQQAAEFNGRST